MGLALNSELALIQINASFLSKCLQTLGVQGFQSFGRKTQPHPTITLGPPNSLPLQINFLELFGAAVRVGNGVGVVRLFAGQLANTGHDVLQAGRKGKT